MKTGNVCAATISAHLDTATVRKRMGVVALAVPSQLSASGARLRQGRGCSEPIGWGQPTLQRWQCPDAPQLSLRQKQSQTLASAACLDEFAHGERVAIIVAAFECFTQVCAAFRQDNVFPNHHRVAGKARRFAALHLYQITNVLTN